MRPRRPRPLLALTLCALATAGCEGRPARRTLEVNAPARLRAALSADDLCAALEARLTFDRTDDLDAPPVDQEALTPAPGKACTWRLAEERQLVAGTYSIKVEFRTKVENPGCGRPVLAGLYFRKDIDFPDGLTPLTEADFFSQPSQAARASELTGETLDFDADGDGSDNLTELSVGADPCHKNSVPQPTLEAPVTAGTEGAPLSLTFGSSDADGVPHQVTLTLQHANSGYEPRTVTVTAYTDDRQPPSVSPDPARRSWDQTWDLAVTELQDARPGAGRWSVTFTPGTPFVNALVAQVTDRDVSGAWLASTAPLDLAVAVDPALHPPLALGSGSAAPQAAFSFTEQGVDAFSFKVVDSGLGSPSGKLSTSPGADFPPGLQLDHPADGTTVLRWSPTNAQAVAATTYQATVLLRDADYVVHPPGLLLTLTISPLFNDPPVVTPPAAQFLSLPPPAQFKAPATVPFSVSDPDQVPTAPTCTVTAVTPLPGTACAQPFDPAPTCGASGPAVEGRWPFALSLSPAASYASCGAAPEFKLSVRVSDSRPAGAWNDDQTATFDVSTRTSRSVVVADLGPAPMSTSIVFVDGAVPRTDLAGGTALFVGNGAAAIAELGNSGAGFKKTFSTAELCSSVTYDPSYTVGSVDRVNHRVGLVGGFLKHPTFNYCDSGLAIVDLLQRTTVLVPEAQLCPGLSSPSLTNPVADPTSGDLYFACATSAASRVVRVDPAGARTVTTVPAFQLDSYSEIHAALVPGADGHPWLVIPTKAGFTLVDLTTLETATKTIINVPLAWGSRKIDERVVDASRSTYLFVATDSAYASTLGRLALPPAASPQVDLLPLGASGYGALRSVVLRQPYRSAATPKPHALVTLGEKDGLTFYGFFWVDLDTWAATADGLTDRFGFTSGNERFWETPDRRFFLQVFPSNVGVDTFTLHPWNGSAPAPNRDLRLQDNLHAAATSAEGFVTVLTTVGKEVQVLSFPDAAYGYDQ